MRLKPAAVMAHAELANQLGMLLLPLAVLFSDLSSLDTDGLAVLPVDMCMSSLFCCS